MKNRIFKRVKKTTVTFLLTIAILMAIFGVMVSGCDNDNDYELEDINIATLRGPTALGMLELMDRERRDETIGDYDFIILGSPDEIPPLLVRGEIDVAAVPSNLAATLYNRMEGDVTAIAVVTLGVLYIVDTTDEIQTIEDLRGRTLYASVPGAMPEFALNYVLTQNGLIPGVDVNIEWRADHTELASLLETGQIEHAMLPEPFVSTVLGRIDGLRIALDLTQEWSRVQPEYGLIMSVVIARTEFLRENPHTIATFMREYEQSINFVTNNIPEAAQLAVDFEIIPNVNFAQSALPRTHIVWMTGAEMRSNLEGFYNVLYSANPESIGGAIPSEAFFFIP